MDHARTGLVANPTKPGAAALARRMAEALRMRGAQVVPDEATAELAGMGEGVPLGERGRRVDRVVILGGDGTLLRTASLMGALVRPLAAVNIGRLGFLTTTTVEELDEFVDVLMGGA